MPLYTKKLVWCAVTALVVAFLIVLEPPQKSDMTVEVDGSTQPLPVENAPGDSKLRDEGGTTRRVTDDENGAVTPRNVAPQGETGKIRVIGQLAMERGAVPLAGCSVFVRESGTILNGDTTSANGRFSFGASLSDPGQPNALGLDVRWNETLLHTREVSPHELEFNSSANVWDLHIDLAIDVTVVRGAIVDDRNAPVSNCGVALVDGGRSDDTLRHFASVPTEPGGRFQLIATSSIQADGILVSADGFVPEVIPTSVSDGGLVDVGTIRLSRGASISGRVISSFPAAERASTVHARIEIGGQLMGDMFTGYLRWFEGALYQDRAVASVSDDGTFVINGLAQASYYVELRRPNHTSLAEYSRSEQRLTAPADGIEIFDRGALIRPQPRDLVTAQPIRANNMLVRIDGESWPPNGWIAADYGVPRSIHLDPHASFRGVASIVGYRDVEFSFTAPGEGEILSRDVYFAPLDQVRDVGFRVVTEYGEPVVFVSAMLRFPAPSDSNPISINLPASKDGCFVARSIPNVPCRMLVSFAGNRIAGAPNLLVPRDVDVPPDLAKDLTVVLQLGGLVELRVTSPSGEPLPASCKWLGDYRELMPTRWMEEGPPIVDFDGWIGPRGRATYVSPLAPGLHKLEVACDGYAERQVEFEVRRGETAKVIVTLSTH